MYLLFYLHILISISAPVLNTPTVSQSKCLTRQYCSGETIEAFKPGHEYTYDYDIETLAEMRGSSENQSKLKIKTRAIVYVKSACDFALRVNKNNFNNFSN